MARTDRQPPEGSSRPKIPRRCEAGNASEDVPAGQPELTRELERILSEPSLSTPREASSWWKRVSALVHELEGRRKRRR